MQPKYDILPENEQEAQHLSQELAQTLELFLFPLLHMLDRLLDKRLVQTFRQCCAIILRFRNQKQGLLLSEMGSYIHGKDGKPVSAPAGTKRIGNLLRSLKWTTLGIDTFLLQEADKEFRRLRTLGKRVLCIWDGSVLEKPESDKAEGLCSVLSSKAKRLNRRKKGLVFNFPAKKAITVTGMQWTGALLCGMEGHIKVALMNWWSTKGDGATTLRKQEEKLLRTCIRQWGNTLLHIFDRGYASGKVLRLLQTFHLHFVIRWKKDHFFRDETGAEKKLWQIGRGKRYRSHKEVYDLATHQKMGCDVWWTPLWHKDYTQQLYLVKVRMKKHVWYLITNERVRKEEEAWEIVFAYKRRWQIELSFRYGKSELAMESPRLWFVENRLKLLGIVTVVYAFLLHLLHPCYQVLVESVLRLKCHRTGKRCREASAPLYRLRWAISRLWEDSRPIFGLFFPPNLEAIHALSMLGCWTRSLKNSG